MFQSDTLNLKVRYDILDKTKEKGVLLMDKDKIIIFDEYVERTITNIEEIDEEEFAIIDILKENNIPYEKEIRKKLELDNYFYWGERKENYLIVMVDKKDLPKVKEVIPEEMFTQNPSLDDLTKEEIEELNKIDYKTDDEKIIGEKPYNESIKDMEKSTKKIANARKKVSFYFNFAQILIGITTMVFFIAWITKKPMFYIIDFLILIVTLRMFSYTTEEEKRITEDVQNTVETKTKPILASLLEEARYSEQGITDTLRKTIYKEAYTYKTFASKNRISGDGYVAAEVDLIGTEEGTFKEYQRDFYGICVKAKSKKHNHEALYVEILPDERDPRKLHVDGYINYFKVDTLSEEFIEKAKELEEKYSAPVTLYYIADVVIIMIENEKFDLKPEEIDGNKIGRIEAKVKRKIELITDYIELSELI